MPTTTMLIIPALVGAIEERQVELSARPAFDKLRDLVGPHLDGQALEHVTVLHNGERRDMFVGEDSAATGIRNVRATEISHANARAWIAADPANARLFPEPWPVVSGPAVLFPEKRVWF